MFPGQQVRRETADVVEDDPALACRGHDRREVVVEQHKVGRFACHVGAPLAHGDADIGFCQCRRVVHAVADHCDDLAALVQIDQIELLLRAHPRKDTLSCDLVACRSVRFAKPKLRRSE